MTTDCQALRWIVALLRRIDVPFQAVGGLAAQAYGARRPLADLDVYIPTSRLDDVADQAGDFVSRPPSHFRSDCWDLTFMKIEHEGISIARHAVGVRRVSTSGSQLNGHSAVSRFRSCRHQLIEYKQRLDREVDRQDAADLVGENQRSAG